MAKWLLTLVFAFTLYGDHCQYGPRLQQQSIEPDNALVALYALAKNGDQRARQRLLVAASSQSNLHWLRLAADLSAPPAIYQQAQAAHAPKIKRELLKLASQRGHADSDLALAALTQSLSARQRYLENAAKQGHAGAMQSLLAHAQQTDNQRLYQTWQPRAARHHPELALAYANQLWLQQGSEVSRDFLHSVRTLGQPITTHIAAIERYSPTALAPQQPASSAQNPSTCAMTIQLIAGTLAAISQAQDLLSQYQQDARLDALPVCFNPPIWLEPETLKCTKQAQKRLSCQPSALIQLANQRYFSHAVVLADQGIANVHNGIMYLDKNDDYPVFVHEFAHFAGFIDEYRLSAEMSEYACGVQGAANLVFAKSLPALQQTAFIRYADQVDELTITATPTCSENKLSAFKPVAQTTFMEHHDIGEIPELYVLIWRDTLLNKKTLIPVYVNFAQALEARGQHLQAQRWWQQYQQYVL